MTVKDLIERLSLTVLTEGDLSREVACGYAGDLLSWVMGRAPASSVWITVMSNINVVAVASLADVSCVILAENAELDEVARVKAEKEKITVLRDSRDIFTLANRIGSLLEEKTNA